LFGFVARRDNQRKTGLFLHLCFDLLGSRHDGEAWPGRKNANSMGLFFLAIEVTARTAKVLTCRGVLRFLQ
jgi:hypothetical protein